MLLFKETFAGEHFSNVLFSVDTYRHDFDSFIKRFPIIGSSTHSIINSIGKGAILTMSLSMRPRNRTLFPASLGWVRT